MSNTLSERAMLATLHIGAWGGHMRDLAVTEAVNESYKASKKDAGNYNKKLVAAHYLAHVGSAVSIARKVHRTLTLPWEDDGTRILSTQGFLEYDKQMRAMRIKFQDAVKEFASNMPDYIKEAEVRLGNMFDKADYPSKEDVIEKFSFDVEIKPMPEARDFRAKLSDASVKAIVKDIERRCDVRLEAAMNDVFERIQDAVGKMSERLRKYTPPKGDKKAAGLFRDSIVYNINELADLIPALNVTGDKRLIQLQVQLKKDLVEHSPEILRTDAKVRAQVATKADAILKKVKAFMA